MNYDQATIARKKRQVSSRKRMKKKKRGIRILQGLLLVFFVLLLAGAVGAGIVVYRVVANAPEITPASVKPSGYTTFVKSADGTVLEEFLQSGSNRIYKSIDEMPEYLGQAFVAVEDERFYEHDGIDLQGIARAAVKGLLSGNFSEGASTLTQQLIKNNVFPNFTEEKTFSDRLERKIQEQYLAVQIEKQMTKDEILEAYMNTINLGQDCLGVQAAALRYFNKDVSELTLSECAVIAGITQNPTRYDPVVNPEENITRRNLVLDNMLEQGYITQEEHDQAAADNVYERISQTVAAEESSPYSYFNDELSQQVIADLMEKKGYTETQAYNALYSGGLTIISTQDTRIQQICDEEVANESVYPYGTEYGLEWALTVTKADGSVQNYSKEMLGEYIRGAWGLEYPLVYSSAEEAQNAVNAYKATLGIVEGDVVDERMDVTPQPQTSVVVMDQYTGEVKAIVGGRGQKTTSLSLNRATDSARQPGSCFKILSTYAPAIDEKGYTLATTIKDEPYKYTNGKTVNNWDGIYIGNTRVRYAIQHSMNICAVKTLTDIGLETGYNELLDFGFTTLVNYDNDNYPGYTDVQQATALGGITIGVYNIEMTAAYAAIASGGTYTKPILYTQILDHDGNVLLDNTADTHQVIKDSTAALLTSAMQDVINKGTGTAAKLSNMPAAGKTGTTENSTDLWLSAYTPYYTASVWGGYDSNKPMENKNQTWHEVLWKNIMERVHEGLEYKEFTMPSSVQQKTVCTQTGYLATSSCPSVTEYFAEGSVPNQSCSGHYVEYYYEETTETTGGSSGSSSGSSSSGTNNGTDSDTTGDSSATDTGDQVEVITETIEPSSSD